jgi:hypothetical protein
MSENQDEGRAGEKDGTMFQIRQGVIAQAGQDGERTFSRV